MSTTRLPRFLAACTAGVVVALSAAPALAAPNYPPKGGQTGGGAVQVPAAPVGPSSSGGASAGAPGAAVAAEASTRGAAASSVRGSAAGTSNPAGSPALSPAGATVDPEPVSGTGWVTLGLQALALIALGAGVVYLVKRRRDAHLAPDSLTTA